MSVFSSTNASRIALNQSLTFTIAVQYEDKKPQGVDVLNLQSLKNFDIINDWSSSKSSVHIVNGRMDKTQTLEYHYELQAHKKGRFLIGPFSVRVNGKIYPTKAIEVKVTDKQKNLPQKPSNSFGIDPFFDSFFSNAPNLIPQRDVGDIKIRLELSKKTVYEGQALKADWILYNSSTRMNYEVDKNPKLKDFWKESISLSPQGQFLGTQVLGDTLYRKTLFDSMILFPLKSGSLVIDSYLLKVNSIFGFGRSGKKAKKSPAKTIQVKPLPIKGRKNFSGAVGHFQVKASLKNKEARVNEPLSYHIEFQGDGHPQFIQLPKLPFPPSFKTYPPVDQSKFNPKGKSFKNYEIILIPQKMGLLEIPSFQVSTFNPDVGRYVYHQIPAFKIKVLKGDSRQEDDDGFQFFKKDSQKSDPEDQALKTLDSFYWPSFLNQKTLQKFWLFFYSILSVFFLALILFPVRKKQESLKGKLKKGFKEIDNLIHHKKWKASSMKMISLVYMVLYERDDQEQSSINWEDLIQRLPPSSYEKYGSRLTEIMKNLEKLSFSPKKVPDQEALMETKLLYKHLRNLLQKVTENRRL